jgi:probable phosphoglycerate mutase
MKRIILIRHAESEHNILGLTGGWSDTQLTDKGRKQAENKRLLST